MMFSIGGKHEPNPVLQRALEILLILHADHEQNCSTSAVRVGRLVARRPLLGGLGRASRRCTGRSTAAPTRRCC